jgi:hypothetical protein
MMTMTNPITPPPELVREWYGSEDCPDGANALANYLCTQAAQWGADQELEACINYFYEYDRQRWGENSKLITGLRAARRPKPPTLKEQALKMLRPLRNPVMTGTPEYRLYEPQAEIIRRALEALDD